MAVAIDSQSGIAVGSLGTITFAFNNVAGNMLIVCAGERATPTGVTYNGVAMTGLGAFGNGASNNGQIFYLANPATGNNNVVVTQTGSVQGTAWAISFSGAGSTPVNYTTATGNSTTPSVTLTSTTSSIVVDWCIHNQGAILTATGTGQTRRVNGETSNAVAGSTTTGAASTTASYSCVGANVWSIGAVSVTDTSTANGKFFNFM